MVANAIDLWAEQLPRPAQDWLNGRRVEEVECIIGDFAGIARGKVMPARKFIKTERSFLPISIFYQTITGEYSDYDTEESWTEKDMVLIPDLNTRSPRLGRRMSLSRSFTIWKHWRVSRCQ